MRAAARLPIEIGEKGDGFLIERRFNAQVGRLAYLTTPGFSLHVFFLGLHNVSFGFISHFTIFKSNMANQGFNTSSYGRPRTNIRRGRTRRRHSIPDSIPAVRGEKGCPWHQRTLRPRRIHRPYFCFQPRSPSEWLLDLASLALSRRTLSCRHQIPTDRDDRLCPYTA